MAESFVRSYKEQYYQNNLSRIAVYTLQPYLLLHLHLYMRDYGSAKLYYQFTMEKYIGVIKPKARSKSKLSVSVSNAVVISEHLNHYSFARPSAVQGNPKQLPYSSMNSAISQPEGRSRALDAA